MSPNPSGVDIIIQFKNKNSKVRLITKTLHKEHDLENVSFTHMQTLMVLISLHLINQKPNQLLCFCCLVVCLTFITFYSPTFRLGLLSVAEQTSWSFVCFTT